MRFDKTKKFDITQLELDEGNYRFRKAKDQRQCIEKIYLSGKDNFKNIMISIAEDDLGEPLLVFENEDGHNIVMDGNRRTSALKVLHNPDMAPSDSIRKKAYALLEDHNVKTNGIQTQVSKDKNTILRTVYERHGSTGGKSRLNWPAIAKSRFGYDYDLDMPESEWKVIALLYKLEDLKPSLTEYFESSSYKHEVFRRIIPAAIKLKIISSNIFSDRDRKVKKSEAKFINIAYKNCLIFFDDIKNEVIGLSRAKNSCIYANTEGVDKYLERFITDKPVDDSTYAENTEGASGKNNDTGTGGSNGETSQEEDGKNNSASNDNTSNSNNSEPKTNGTSNNGVTFSNELKQAILKTNSKKFEQLYDSICIVALRKHPSLVMLGAWALIEAIASATGKLEGTGIDSHFSKKKLTKWWPNYFSRTQLSDFHHSLEFIRKDANGIKHSPKYRSDSAMNLKAHFECLDELLIKLLEKTVTDKVKIS